MVMIAASRLAGTPRAAAASKARACAARQRRRNACGAQEAAVAREGLLGGATRELDARKRRHARIGEDLLHALARQAVGHEPLDERPPALVCPRAGERACRRGEENEEAERAASNHGAHSRSRQAGGTT